MIETLDKQKKKRRFKSDITTKHIEDCIACNQSGIKQKKTKKKTQNKLFVQILETKIVKWWLANNNQLFINCKFNALLFNWKFSLFQGIFAFCFAHIDSPTFFLFQTKQTNLRWWSTFSCIELPFVSNSIIKRKYCDTKKKTKQTERKKSLKNDKKTSMQSNKRKQWIKSWSNDNWIFSYLCFNREKKEEISFTNCFNYKTNLLL